MWEIQNMKLRLLSTTFSNSIIGYPFEKCLTFRKNIVTTLEKSISTWWRNAFEKIFEIEKLRKSVVTRLYRVFVFSQRLSQQVVPLGGNTIEGFAH